MSNHFYDVFEVTKMHEAIEEKAELNSQVGIREMSESELSDEVTKWPVVVKTW